MSREPISLYPSEEPEANGKRKTEPPTTRERHQAAGLLALGAIACFTAAIIMGWGVIGLLVALGFFGLVAAVLVALPRKPRP